VTATRRISHRLRDVEGYAALDLCGEIGKTTATQVAGPLGKALMDRGRVVAAVSELTVSWPPALAVFPSSLAHAGGWPLARLVILGARPALASELRAARIDRSVPLAETWDAAKVLLGDRPERISRDVWLPCGVEASRLARFATTDTCRDWELDRLALEAQMVATELVINAIEHARTECTLTFSHSRGLLHVAVRDWSPISEEARQRFTEPGRPGRGLVLVNGLARHWGVTRHADGKTVWAVLDAGTS
jgi:hypothetical protein